MTQTPIYGLPFEKPGGLPGITLDGGPDGLHPILAERVETTLSAQLAALQTQIGALQADIAALNASRTERIETVEVTSSVGPFTTSETVITTIIAPVVVGRDYWITHDGNLQSDGGVNTANIRIREDDDEGTQLNVRRVSIPINGAGTQAHIEASYTAVSSENKTFVVTAVRSTGSNNITAGATVTQRLLTYVDLIGT